MNAVVLRVFGKIGEQEAQRFIQAGPAQRASPDPILLGHADVAEMPADGTIEVVDADFEEVVRHEVEQPEGLLSGLLQITLDRRLPGCLTHKLGLRRTSANHARSSCHVCWMSSPTAAHSAPKPP